MDKVKVRIVAVQLRPTVNLTIEFVADTEKNLVEIMKYFKSAKGVKGTLSIDEESLDGDNVHDGR